MCIRDTKHKQCVSQIPDINVVCIMDTRYKYYVSWIPYINIMYHGYQT